MFLLSSRLVYTVIMLWCSYIPSVFCAPPTKYELAVSIANLFTSHNKKNPSNKQVVIVRILTPAKQLKQLCAKPELRPAGQTHALSGNHSIIASCGTKRQFIQAHISATGTWWQARHTLPSGHPVSSLDIQAHHGLLDRLPADVITDPAQITGRTPTRTISVGQPLRQSQLRKSWVVIAGKMVDITATGNGFLIRTRGKALGNAALNETFRIHTATGQLLTATATGQGKAAINLQD